MKDLVCENEDDSEECVKLTFSAYRRDVSIVKLLYMVAQKKSSCVLDERGAKAKQNRLFA